MNTFTEIRTFIGEHKSLALSLLGIASVCLGAYVYRKNLIIGNMIPDTSALD